MKENCEQVNRMASKTHRKNSALKDHLQAPGENFWNFVSSIECNKSLALTKQKEKKLRFKR